MKPVASNDRNPTQGPHPEERRFLAARLEGWPLAQQRLLPSFETAAHRNRLFPILTLLVAEVGQARLRWAASSDFIFLSFRGRLTPDAVSRGTPNGPGRSSSQDGRA